MNELLVPVDLQALVIGTSEDDTRREWVNLKPDFSGIRRGRVLGRQFNDSLEFSRVTSGRKPGVYLHWALPDGLTRGKASHADGQARFDAIPNRWLVVRLREREDEAAAPGVETRAWIVESDAVVEDRDAVSWPTLPPGDRPEAKDYVVHVGKTMPLADWPGEVEGPRVPLTAMGYGDALFAAYYPACRGILGFHDDLEDVPAGTRVNYLVVGWYSDGTGDPLQQALQAADASEDPLTRLAGFMDARGWTYPGLDVARGEHARMNADRTELREAKAHFERLKKRGHADAASALARRIDELETQALDFPATLTRFQEALPKKIVCHGLLTGVRGGDHVDHGVPLGKPFRLALGETLVEALAALLEPSMGPEVSELLALFQYDLLEELERPGGDLEVASRVHERLFRPRSRGIRWDLMQASQPGFGSGADTRSPPVPGDIRAALDELNTSQRRLDELARRRDLLKDQVYLAWYRQALAPGAGLAPALADARSALAQADAELARARSATPAPRPDAPGEPLQSLMAHHLPGWKLQSLEDAPFWRPNDPVVLIAGEAARRPPRHGGDGRFRVDGRLRCRVAGQTLSGLRVTLPFAAVRDVPFGAAEIDRWCDPAACFGSSAIPAPSVPLLREALLLTLQERRAEALVVAVQEAVEPGLSTKRPQDTQAFIRQLLDQYLQRVWSDARNGTRDDPSLRIAVGSSPGETVWELFGRMPSPIAVVAWERNPWLPLFMQWEVQWRPTHDDAESALKAWTLGAVDFQWQGDARNAFAGEPVVYRGTSLLGAHAASQLSERLRRYALEHGDDSLARLQATISSLDATSQSLGGFTDQLLMRKAHTELPPLDVDGQVLRPSPIHAEVNDIDWLAPSGERFLPLRGGRLVLQRLWIIDAFGQFIALEEEGALQRLRPQVPPRLRSGDGAMLLPPRLAQSARIALQWLPPQDAAAADRQADPILGWILPNLLDRSFMIYDAQGQALGGLQVRQTPSWRDGAGSRREPVPSLHWIDLPGRARLGDKPTGEIVDTLDRLAPAPLRDYVRGLLSMGEGSGAAFEQLLEDVGQTLAAGAGGGANPNLTLLVGKPLALVRARLSIEVEDGALATATEAGALAWPTGGIEHLSVPLRLGERRSADGHWIGGDGLLGFFDEDKYDRFHPAWGLSGRNDGYHTYGVQPELQVGKARDFTLLMDPAGGLSVSSGLLPKTRFRLPNDDLAQVLDNKELVFFSGPVLGPPAAGGEMRMPEPSDAFGQWSWTHPPELGMPATGPTADTQEEPAQWREKPIVDTQKEWPRACRQLLELQDGWLRLLPAPPAIREFALLAHTPHTAEQAATRQGETPLPARYRIAENEPVVLQWSVEGADAIELRHGDRVLFASRRHPLPMRFVLVPPEPFDTLTLTLHAVGRHAWHGDARKLPTSARRTLVIERDGA